MGKVIIVNESQLKNIIEKVIISEQVEVDYNKLPKNVIYNDENSKNTLVNAGLDSRDPYKDPKFKLYYPDSLRTVNTVGNYVYNKVTTPPVVSGYKPSAGSGNYGYKNNPNTAKGYVATKPSQGLPKELGNVDGVKRFQDWLDQNVKGWATGYPNGVLNRSKNSYGKFGPRTSGAWNKYKGTYIKSLQKSVAPVQPQTTQSTPTQSSGNLMQSKIYNPETE